MKEININFICIFLLAYLREDIWVRNMAVAQAFS